MGLINPPLISLAFSGMLIGICICHLLSSVAASRLQLASPQTQSKSIENTSSKTFRDKCFDSSECNYTAHLRCLERECQCYGKVLVGFPNVTLALAMEWNLDKKACLSVLNSICTGSNEGGPPENKIHAECLPGLGCIQRNDLELGVGTCLPQQQESIQDTVIQFTSTAIWVPFTDSANKEIETTTTGRTVGINTTSTATSTSLKQDYTIVSSETKSGDAGENASEITHLHNPNLIIRLCDGDKNTKESMKGVDEASPSVGNPAYRNLCFSSLILSCALSFMLQFTD